MEEIFAFTSDIADKVAAKNEFNRQVGKAVEKVILSAEEIVSSATADEANDGRLPYGETFVEDDTTS